MSTDRGNFAANYPPVYYGVMGLFAGPDLQVSALVIRAVNAVIFVGVTTALYLLLPVRRRPTLVLSWVVTVVPFGAFLIASNNPSGWAILSGGTLWLALVGWFEGTGNRKWGLGALAVVAAVLGAGARADSAVYNVVAILAAVLLTMRRDRDYLLRCLLPAAILVVSAAFFLSTSQSMASVKGLDNPDPVQGYSTGVLTVTNFLQLPELWLGAFGGWGLGWFDTMLPAIVSVGGLGVFAAVVFWGLRFMSRAKALVLFGVLAVLWLMPVYLLVKSHTVVGELVQPRYILPMLTLGAGVAVFTTGRRLIDLTLTQLVVIGTVVSIANSVAMHTNMRRYITGLDIHDFNLNRSIEWWWDIPVSPMIVWILGSVTFALAIAVLLRELRRTQASRTLLPIEDGVPVG